MKRIVHTSILALGLALLRGGDVHASEYPGWGDTGWVYESKRDCCNDAIAIASQYSAQACITSGGRPSPFAGVGNRGTCSWQMTQDGDGNTLNRCNGEATVWCE